MLLSFPALRSARVSPIQRMTEKPCSSANAVFLPTKSGLSPSTWRRSEWPVSTHVQPASRSMAAEISPVKAPASAGYIFCAPTKMPGAPSRPSPVASRAVNGANTTTSLSSGAPPRIEASSCAVALASVRVLFIFQLAAIMVRIEYSHERNLWIRPSLSHIQSINERVFSGILIIPAPLARLPKPERFIQMDGGRVADPHFKHSS